MTEDPSGIQSSVPDLTGMTLDEITQFYRDHAAELGDGSTPSVVKTETSCSSLTPF